MIRSLVLQDVDMAWSSLRVTADRHSAVDFLYPYYKNTYSLVNLSKWQRDRVDISIIFQVIRRQESQIYSWILFLSPMNQSLWIGLVVHSLFVLVILWSFWRHYSRSSSVQRAKSIMQLIQEQIQHYLTMCSSYLGRSCGPMPHDHKSSVKVGFQQAISKLRIQAHVS